MTEGYKWIAEIKEILDTLPDAKTDYEEMAKIKRLQSLVNKEVKETVASLTSCESGQYINLLKNEISDAVYEYALAYMKEKKIRTTNFELVRGIFNGRVMLSIRVDSKDRGTVNTHKLGHYVTHLNFRKIIEEMTGIGYANDYWATPSMYEAFQEAKRKDPEWIEKYCVDIAEALDSIKVSPVRKKAAKKTGTNKRKKLIKSEDSTCLQRENS